MRFLIAYILICLFLATGFAQTTQPSAGTRVIGTRVSLKPPPGFIPAPQFSGFANESLQSSIIVMEISAPFSEISQGVSDPAQLLKRGMTLLNKQTVTVDGRSGVLSLVRQTIEGTEYLKWMVVFGDERETVTVVATFPKSLELEISDKVKASVLTATVDTRKTASLAEGLPFTITEKGQLKLARRLVNTLLFTANGIFPSESPDNPVFIVGQNLRKVAISNGEEFAKTRLSQTASVTNFQIEQSNKVTIDSLSGYEIVAKATDVKSGQPMMVYQTLLFIDEGYYLFQGLVGSKNKETDLRVFREMTASFKRSK